VPSRHVCAGLFPYALRVMYQRSSDLPTRLHLCAAMIVVSHRFYWCETEGR
jgi:hypothetical protein